MVWKLPLPLHERFSAPWSRFHHLQNRIRGWLSEDVRQKGSVPSWIPLYWYANQGERVIYYILLFDTELYILYQAASDKIVREIELFGENFEKFYEDLAGDEPVAPVATEAAPSKPSGPAKAPEKSKKGKLAAKTVALKYQFQIMESIGVPREEIKKFADPYYWLTYFPPICMVRILSSLPAMSAHGLVLIVLWVRMITMPSAPA